MAASEERPEVLLLSLSYMDFLDEVYASLFQKLENTARVQRAKSPNDAIQYLTKNRPKAVIITDEGLTLKANAIVLPTLIWYLRAGGIAIIGLHFPNFGHFDAIDSFFESAFDLPWKCGSYTKNDLEVNPFCKLPDGVALSSLAGPQYVKALYIKHARPDEKIIVPEPVADEPDSEEPEIEDMPQKPEITPEYLEETQATTTGAKIGNGYLVYCGNVNPGDELNRIILALCGLQA